jgi:hypothetical protein
MASAKTAYKRGQASHEPNGEAKPVVIADVLPNHWSRNASVRVGETPAERRARVETVRKKYAHLSGAHTDEYLEEKLQQTEAEFARHS